MLVNDDERTSYQAASSQQLVDGWYAFASKEDERVRCAPFCAGPTGHLAAFRWCVQRKKTYADLMVAKAVEELAWVVCGTHLSARSSRHHTADSSHSLERRPRTLRMRKGVR